MGEGRARLAGLLVPVCGRAKDGAEGEVSHGSGSAACSGCSSPACRPAHSTVSSSIPVIDSSATGQVCRIVTNLDALAELGQPVANRGVDAGAEQQHTDGEGKEERPGPDPARSCGRHDILI